MQIKQNNITDARNFQEIWNSLDRNQQSMLRVALSRDLDITRQTIANWSKGVMPVNVPTMKVASDTVNRVLNIKTDWTTLFPAR